jgi:cytosine/adenosine deaminase-related metal-dependent hydrolase
MNLVRDEVIDLSTAFRLLATNPAQLLGVDAGELAVGLQADIAIIDADRPGSSPRPKWPRRATLRSTGKASKAASSPCGRAA